jgi:Holliday junction resolvase
MKKTPYRYGYLVEQYCKRILKNRGYTVFRSAGSKGAADLTAINPQKHEILLVQVKKEEAPKDKSKLPNKYSKLSKLKGQYTCKTLLFIKDNRKYTFIEV